jgi:hypothetical protein
VQPPGKAARTSRLPKASRITSIGELYGALNLRHPKKNGDFVGEKDFGIQTARIKGSDSEKKRNSWILRQLDEDWQF